MQKRIISRLAGIIMFMLTAGPGFAQARLGPAGEDPAALRLMNDTQLQDFLKRLDAEIVSWKARLKAMDVASLRFGQGDVKETRRSYSLCMLAPENARGDIEQLTQKQTLKLDFLLLMDLNTLARSLDRLSSNLASPVTVEKASFAQRSLSWSRVALSIDVALGAHVNEIQHHALALAGLLDAALERAEQNADQSRK